jgi:hypothetical protein
VEQVISDDCRAYRDSGVDQGKRPRQVNCAGQISGQMAWTPTSRTKMLTANEQHASS